MSETFTYRGSLSWGIPAGQLSSLLPEGLDKPLGEVGEVGREVGVGLELPARGLPLPSEMNAPAQAAAPGSSSLLIMAVAHVRRWWGGRWLQQRWNKVPLPQAGLDSNGEMAPYFLEDRKVTGYLCWLVNGSMADPEPLL